MPAPYIHTPRTNDATYLSNDGLDNISPEKSFAAPADTGDLITQMKKVRAQGMNLKTPRVGGRDPLKLIPNAGQGNNKAKPEFTPLMRSVTKTNMARRLSARKSSGAETPAYLRNSYVGGATPGLPRMEEESHMHSELTGSSVGRNDYTPMLQNLNSSAQSTPLAQLPGRDVAVNDGNMMTLREQENIIDKIEKENFGLKMKIHFLEEAISKRGGEFNHTALKENTDLKVNRVTMQRELHKQRKNLAQAERDTEIYRQQLEDYKERVRRKQIDESIRIEIETVRSELKSKNSEFDDLRAKYDSIKSQTSSEVEKLRDEIGDLEAELREKVRQIEEKEDEIDSFKTSSKQESNTAAELEDELESARRQLEELREDFERVMQDAKDAKEEREEAVEEKRRAENNLDELQEEMANKSFTTKGLSRQLEEKVDRLEEENQDLEQRNAALQAERDQRVQSERVLQERLREVEKEGTSDARQLQHELEAVRQQREISERKHNSAQQQVESLQRELQVKVDEKDLLQSRHDALTVESQELQKDLATLRKSSRDLESALELERQQAMRSDNILRTQHKTEIDLLNEQIDTLHREINTKENDYAGDLEEWESQKRSLESASRRAEERVTGLQRTVDRLNDAQGTLNGRELQVQEALESEKQRHAQEEKVLHKQIEELNQDLAEKRTTADGTRSELNNAREELRISIREQASLKEKVIELEDEIEVLQADIEQEHEIVQQLQQKSSNATDAQITKFAKEKKDLQESLASLNAQLQSAKQAVEAAESERDEFELKLQKAEQAHDDTFDAHQEKRDLRRTKQKLENDLEKVRAERDNLAAANEGLEAEINAEIERSNAEESRLQRELDQLKNKQLASSDGRDRELSAAKHKVTRLEGRVQELEDMLDNQSRRIESPGVDVSGLRHDLAEARKSEMAATKRESDLKSAHRDLKIKVNELERDLHEARLAHLKSRSPTATPPPSHSKELVQLRQDLGECRAQLKVLQDENRDLKRAARRVSSQTAERDELEALVNSNSAELAKLTARLIERDDEIDEVRAQLKRVRSERNEARNYSVNSMTPSGQVNDLHVQIKRLRTERDELRHILSQPSSQGGEALQMKSQLKRLREDRTRANKRAEAIEEELEMLQSRYESVLEKLSASHNNGRPNVENSDTRDKEIRGLIKEITWLKAKCHREQRLRLDLAWSKTYLEQGELMRSQCNQVDLRILREIGINVDSKKYEKPLTPKQKLRAGVYAVMAAIRMSKMEEQWRDAKLIGQALRMSRARR